MFSSGGVVSPPTHGTSTGALLGVSLPSYYPSSSCLGSCSSDASDPAALAGWTSPCRLWLLWVIPPVQLLIRSEERRVAGQGVSSLSSY